MTRKYRNLSSDQIMREQRDEEHTRTQNELARVAHKLPLFQLAPNEPLAPADQTPEEYNAAHRRHA